jgi:hypothetical protein
MLTPEQKDRVRKLVHALRTTKKQQGTGKLARYLSPNRKAYCCLGIACEVAHANGLPLKRKKENAYVMSTDPIVRYVSPSNAEDSSASMLPSEVANWYGFSDIDPPLISEHGDRSFATELNDGRHYNFKRIAAAFERTYLSE